MQRFVSIYNCFFLDAPAPPVHVINRGILIEGLGCILAGIWVRENILKILFSAPKPLRYYKP
jgi:hypothetical protein